MEVIMRAEVRKHDAAVEFTTPERCHITEVANDAGDELVSIARARVEPDVTTAWHRLKGVSERYIIVSGEGRVEIGELQPVDVCAGDVVRIPADVAQRISNTGNDDLVFYAVCSPPFEAGCYVSLE
ncbi:MAG TPA: cupin domain-containing protein [Gammaproteobacteria bacterium]|jgi:mannose-6-phosphate isomerase-like protein (cupin superfamily)